MLGVQNCQPVRIINTLFGFIMQCNLTGLSMIRETQLFVFIMQLNLTGLSLIGDVPRLRPRITL